MVDGRTRGQTVHFCAFLAHLCARRVTRACVARARDGKWGGKAGLADPSNTSHLVVGFSVADYAARNINSSGALLVQGTKRAD
jgi:hypothetical protein